ncbi:hypothetical protein [Burkholderia cenocepacia]|uniref:hypothetical protein n=1 Tax=Burkholderia cenocepacia TaxID=95486 RepID=UPI000F59DBD8|nr:hypothetical protein [Burkholderia cenocepacia]RQU48241.1 hypothetical protein DF143_37805 [Burkholderia cenocepacia]RQV31319.1 hypothetical protein DF033_37330 [Burkholderia cenocepacia]
MNTDYALIERQAAHERWVSRDEEDAGEESMMREHARSSLREEASAIKTLRANFRVLNTAQTQMGILNTQLKTWHEDKVLTYQAAGQLIRGFTKFGAKSGGSWVGGGIGGTLGTMVTPGVGTVIGATLGTMIGSGLAGKAHEVATEKIVEGHGLPPIAPAMYPKATNIYEEIQHAMEKPFAPDVARHKTKVEYIKNFGKYPKKMVKAIRAAQELSKLIPLPYETLVIKPYDFMKWMHGVGNHKAEKLLNVMDYVEDAIDESCDEAVRAVRYLDEKKGEVSQTPYTQVENIAALMDLEGKEGRHISLNRVMKKYNKTMLYLQENRTLIYRLKSMQNASEGSSDGPFQELAKALSG